MTPTRTATNDRHGNYEPTSAGTTLDHPATSSRSLLRIEDLRELGLGRQLAYLLIDRLPHISTGKRKLVSRPHLEAYLLRAATAKCDLWEDLRNPTGIWRSISDGIGVSPA